MNRRDFLKTGTFAAVGGASECAVAARTDGDKDALAGVRAFRTYFTDVDFLVFYDRS